jgi:hypothetical protein
VSGNIKPFPGVADATKAPDEQPDVEVVAFCEDLVRRAKSGEIRAIAVAMVQPGRTTADGWRRSSHSADCCHELMAAITYLQLRYGNQVNTDSERLKR